MQCLRQTRLECSTLYPSNLLVLIAYSVITFLLIRFLDLARAGLCVQFLQDWIRESQQDFKQSHLASQCTHRYVNLQVLDS